MDKKSAGTTAPESAGELETTGLAQREAWYAKTWPPVEKVRPNVWSVPIPVPDNPIRYTLCYLLFGAGELVVVDPGWETEDGWRALVDGLAAAGATASQVTGIVITHVHPDHHLMSARLAAASGAWIAMHPAEREFLVRWTGAQTDGPSIDEEWLVEQGMPTDVLATVAVPESAMAAMRLMAEPTRLLDDGEMVPLADRRIKAVWTPGHTPGHLCLHDEDNDVLLTGDHVLPRISPNVGLQSRSSPPPLGPYLNSLRRLAAYDSAEVLPAHEWRFRGLNLRLDQLLHHHQLRLDEILGVLTTLGSASAWQVTERLTWSRGWPAIKGFQQRSALAETLAHLIYLQDLGTVTVVQTPGAASVFRVADGQPAAASQ